MEVSLIDYDAGDVFGMLQKVCGKEGYVILERDEAQWIIKAKKSFLGFVRRYDLELRVVEDERGIVVVKVRVMRDGVWMKEVEEKFTDAVNRVF